MNAIDCVYIDVDHHYYHSNEGIAPGSESYYAEIDIPAGYQRLCGLKALQYVRYRHDDNDIVRAARQQDFLREARQKVPPSELLNKSQRPDRHLHQVHDLGHQQPGDSGQPPEAPVGGRATPPSSRSTSRRRSAARPILT